MPRFVATGNSERIYAKSLVDGIKLIARRGYMKEYSRSKNQMPWRGRFLASDTIRKHAAKGVRYRHEFEHSVLTSSTVENIALKMALTQVIEWFEENDRNNMVLQEARLLLRDLYHVA